MGSINFAVVRRTMNCAKTALPYYGCRNRITLIDTAPGCIPETPSPEGYDSFRPRLDAFQFCAEPGLAQKEVVLFVVSLMIEGVGQDLGDVRREGNLLRFSHRFRGAHGLGMLQQGAGRPASAFWIMGVVFLERCGWASTGA